MLDSAHQASCASVTGSSDPATAHRLTRPGRQQGRPAWQRPVLRQEDGACDRHLIDRD
jgi:hypothetical protein